MTPRRNIRICKSEAKFFPSLWATKLCHRRKVSFTANLRLLGVFGPAKFGFTVEPPCSKRQVLEIGNLFTSSAEKNTYYKHTANGKPFRLDCIGTIVVPSSTKVNESLTTKSPWLTNQQTIMWTELAIYEQSWKDISRR